MGRLSEARKKAKKAGGGENQTPPEAPGTEAPPAAAPAVLPSSGLADDILSGKLTEESPAAPPGGIPSSGLADEILAPKPKTPKAPKPAKAPVETRDDDFGGFAAPARAESPASLPSSGLADELLASLAAVETKPLSKTVEDDFADGVLRALEQADVPPPAPMALGSSGLAEDVLRTSAPERKQHLALDEIHEFETFFENESEVEQLHLVLFHMAEEVFALDIDRVQEIIRVPGVTRVPHVAGHVLGVCNLRGRIVPVMELRKLMRMESRPIDRLSRILVLDFAGKQIGMLVDRANEVAHIRVSDIEPPPEEVRAVDRNLVTAVARLNARMVFILDLDQILAMK